MIISEDHLQWASISRIATLLKAEHREFEVTASYAFLVPILCWTMQRLRASDWEKSSCVQRLKGESLESLPWAIISPPEFGGFNMFRFLEALRNAVAHGDDRRIIPVSNNGKLTEYRFCCNEQKKKKIIWEGSISLSGPTMRRIGCELANRFCDALSLEKDSYFVAEAEAIRERAA